MLSTQDVKRLIENGHTICPVGQLTRNAAAWLRRAYRSGKLVARESDWPDRRLEYRKA